MEIIQNCNDINMAEKAGDILSKYFPEDLEV